MLAYTAFKKHFQEDELNISYISKKITCATDRGQWRMARRR